MRRCPITSALLASAIFVISAVITATPQHPARAASTQPASTEPAKEEQLSPEQQMRRRFPQPARVRDIVGLPVLDWSDNTLGYVQRVVRTRDGKIQLIVRYGGWFGWIGWWQRPVAVPIEVIALIGPHVGALDMTTEQFRTAPTWQPSADSTEVPAEEIIRVAITRR
jgi:PRC-barrel domain